MVLERSPVETKYPLPSSTYMAVPRTSRVRDLEATIREKAGVPTAQQLIILWGEQRIYEYDDSLEVIY